MDLGWPMEKAFVVLDSQSENCMAWSLYYVLESVTRARMEFIHLVSFFNFLASLLVTQA